MSNHRLLSALTVGAALLLTGCGASDSDKAASATKDYLSALADADYSGACDRMSDHAREGLQASAKGLGGSTSCEGLLKMAFAFITDEQKKLKDADVQIASVKVDGDRASVTVKGGTEPATLVKEDGDWKIDDVTS